MNSIHLLEAGNQYWKLLYKVMKVCAARSYLYVVALMYVKCLVALNGGSESGITSTAAISGKFRKKKIVAPGFTQNTQF
jgi:hypothetical protein